MAHLEVRVDGETRYDGEVSDIALPSLPEQFPTALGYPGLAPGQTAPPLAKLTILTALVEVIRRAIGESPLMQPAQVQVQSRGMGRVTVLIDLELPA